MSDQTRRWIRTAIQVVVGVAAMLPGLLDATGLDAYGWAAGAVAVSAVVARVMALPIVDAVLTRVGLGLGEDGGGGA